MLSRLTPTEVAFMMAGLTQAVAALAWLIASWLVAYARGPALRWAGYAALSALSFVCLVAAMQQPDPVDAELVRAAGNISLLIGLLALQRGAWHFVGLRPATSGQLLALAVAVAASVIGLDPSAGATRVGLLSGVQSILVLQIARDLHRYARDGLKWRWPAMLPLPLLLAGVLFGARSLRALLSPDSVLAEMTVHSSLNLASAFAYVVLALSFHAMLLLLVVVRLVGDLRRLSRHDALTGLLNRRALEEALQAQVQRSRRSGEPFCVLMLDADHFKAINDRYGHGVGDEALKHLSELFLGHMREVDQLARVGGEEFLVLLPGLALTAALPVAERLRELVAAAPLPNGGEAIPMSVSIGIAEWGGAQEDTTRLMKRVDAALYQAKHQGRDRVASARHDLHLA